MQLGKSFGLAMLNIKKCNLFLISTVFVLLLVSILVGIKVLFSNMHGLEWGSVTDWFSAISTLAGSIASFGTLYIAYKAFQKAPEWLDQKKYNIAHEIIEQSIYSNLQKVRTTSQHLKILFTANIDESIKALGAGVIHPSLEKIAFNLDSIIDDYSIVTYSIINDLNKIRRNGYVLSDYSTNIINTLKNTNHTYQNIYNHLFLTNYYEIESLKEASEQAKEFSKQEFKSIVKEVNELHQSLAKFTSEIYSNNYPFEYFIITEK
ncbi:hypothetical protein ACNZ7H_004442 [Escherichia coli]